MQIIACCKASLMLGSLHFRAVISGGWWGVGGVGNSPYIRVYTLMLPFLIHVCMNKD